MTTKINYVWFNLLDWAEKKNREIVRFSGLWDSITEHAILGTAQPLNQLIRLS